MRFFRICQLFLSHFVQCYPENIDSCNLGVNLEIQIKECKGKSMKYALLFLTVISITACAIPNIQKHGAIDTSNKTMSVPMGQDGAIVQVKAALENSGWQLSEYADSSLIDRNKNRLEQLNKMNTRYTLFYSDERYDTCVNFSPALKYEIAVVDNNTGWDVIEVDGMACEGQVADRFMRAMN